MLSNEKSKFSVLFCLVFERSTLQTILILNSHSSLLFFSKTVCQKKRSDCHNLASVSLTVIERESVSSQGPPWSSAEFGCCGGHLSIVVASTGCYDHKKTFLHIIQK